jgi:short-subunit dehydrogenase
MKRQQQDERPQRRSPRPTDPGTVLITGASRGIGLELSKIFAAAGHDLILVARSRGPLQEIRQLLERSYGVRVKAIVKDLSRSGAAESLHATLTRSGVAVDILVNNAGAMVNADFAKIPLARHAALLQLNVVATVELTQLLLIPMLQRRRGRILNVASMAAFQPLPRLATYAASKAFVLHLTEALAEELRGTGVTATALCPGFTDTEILSEAPDVTRLPGFAIGSAVEVARDAYRACMRGAPLCVSGAGNQLAVQLIRYQPRWMVRTIAGALARRSV